MASNAKKYWPIFVLLACAVICWIFVVNAFYNDYAARFVTGTLNPDDVDVAFNNFYYSQSILWPVVTIVTFLLCIKVFGINMPGGKIWLLLTVAMVFWFLGDAYYGYEWFFNNTETMPAVLHFGRICYIIGYIILLVALALQVKVGGVKIAKKEIAFIAIIEGIFLFVSLWFCVAPISQIDLSISTTMSEELEKWILVFYLLFDEINIFLTIILIFKYRGGQFSTGWTILSLGFMAEAVYDMVYSYTSYILADFDPMFANAWYFFEPIYYIAYIMLAVGALYLFISVRNAKA